MATDKWVGRCGLGACSFATGNSDVLAYHYRTVHGVGRPSTPRPSPPSLPARASSPSPANAIGRAPGSDRPDVSHGSVSALLAQQSQLSLRQDRAARTRIALARLLEYNRSRGIPAVSLAGITGYSERRVRELLVLAAQLRQEERHAA